MTDPRMFTEIIQFDPASQQQKHSDIEKAMRAQQHLERLDEDYKDWQACRDYVLANMHKLKKTKVAVDVFQITNLKEMHCLILNDLILIPYHEAEEMIKKVEKEELEAAKAAKEKKEKEENE